MGRQRDSDDRHAPRVLIAVPTRDMTAAAISGRLALLLVDLARRPESPAIEIVPGHPVDRVRNLICTRFLESDADYLLMIDDDVVPPATILEMVRRDKDVVASLCYAFVPFLGYYAVAYPPEGEDGARTERLGIGRDLEFRGLLEVELAGSACMLVRRRVLEALDPPYFKMELDDDCLQIEDSEDFAFCRRVREAGFSIWLDTDQPCGHHKALDMRASLLWAQKHAARRRPADPDP